MAWWERAKVGDRIVALVNRTACGYSVSMGSTYVIRDIFVYPHPVAGRASVLFTFAGMPSGTGWRADIFRPAEDINSHVGMEVLKRIAAGGPVEKATEEPKRRKVHS